MLVSFVLFYDVCNNVCTKCVGIIAFNSAKIVEGSLTLADVDDCLACKDFKFKSGPLKADGHVSWSWFLAFILRRICFVVAHEQIHFFFVKE